MSPSTASFTEIDYAVEGPIATLTLDRPGRLNAFTVTMMREMIEAIDLVDGDDEVRVLIVTGRGRGFCAGADLGPGGDTFNAEQSGGAAVRSTDRPASAATPGMVVGG